MLMSSMVTTKVAPATSATSSAMNTGPAKKERLLRSSPSPESASFAGRLAPSRSTSAASSFELSSAVSMA